MTAAVGRPRSPTAWPKPVMVPPRGIRERLWLTAIVGAPVLSLALQGGWYFLAAAAVITTALRPRPRTLIAWATAILTAWTCAMILAQGPRNTANRAWDVLSHNLPTEPSSSALLDAAALGLAAGLTTVATLTAYDTRRVTRGVVDERVWERQHQRRVAILRREARAHPPGIAAP